MHLKRRRSSVSGDFAPKRVRIGDPLDYISNLSDELLVRILHHLPLSALLKTHLISRRFYTLSSDSQIWKSLYYNRFVLPRALRIPGIKNAPPEHVLHFSSRRSKWLNEETLLEGRSGLQTNWKRQYKLRHNWSIGACEVQEIRVKEKPSIPSMLVKLAEGVVLTVDKEDGLRAWELKSKALIAKSELDEHLVPSCLAVDETEAGRGELGIAIGFTDGRWGSWVLDLAGKTFSQSYCHPASSSGILSAIAYSNPYVLTITESQLLSLYSFTAPPIDLETKNDIEDSQGSSSSETNHSEDLDSLTGLESGISLEPLESVSASIQPRLLASLKSLTSWPPLSLSIRNSSTAIIASIAYSLPTYLSGYTVGLQELHLHHLTGLITSSRLTSALPSFSPLSSSPSSSPPRNITSTRPTSLSYNHPYILATHADNTLTLYLCTSTKDDLKLTAGTKLWGHTSSVASAEITARGKAVSVCGRGEELRVWELEGGLGSGLREVRKRPKLSERSVMIRPEKSNTGRSVDELEWVGRRHWVGFDDEVVIVLKENGRGAQALMVYDFT